MKALSAVLVLVLAASSFGAVVVTNQTVVGSNVNIQVGLDGQGSTLNAFDIIFSSDTVPLTNWTFAAVNPAWSSTSNNGNSGLTGAANELWVGAASTVSGQQYSATSVAPLVVGTLVVPVSAAGQTVNYGDQFGVSGIGTPTGLVALSGSFQVVPEPMTMALLALGGLLVARRRHA